MSIKVNYELGIACTEVIEIIKIMGESYKNKLPINILDALEKGKLEDYKTNINPENKIDEQQLSRKAIAILSMLNVVYWIDDKKEKNRLISIYIENDKKKISEQSNIMLNKFREDKNLNNQEQENKMEEQNKLPIKTTVWTKIKTFFVKLLKKNKEEK